MLQSVCPRVVIVFFLVVFLLSPSLLLANRCSDSDYSVHPELLKMAFDKVASRHLDKAGRAALLNLYRSGISTQKTPVNQLLKKLPDVLTAIEFVEASAANDTEKLQSLVLSNSTELALKAFGVPFSGAIMSAYTITKTSFDEVRHQECLFNIDQAYFKFLSDSDFKGKTINQQVSLFYDKYIFGGKKGNFQHRQNLQCYIDEELPGQNIQIEHNGNPFGMAAEVLASINMKNTLRPAIHAMLSDFHARHRIEQQRREFLKYIARPEFKLIKSTLPLLGSYEAIQDWICEEYIALVDQKGNGDCSDTERNKYSDGKRHSRQELRNKLNNINKKWSSKEKRIKAGTLSFYKLTPKSTRAHSRKTLEKAIETRQTKINRIKKNGDRQTFNISRAPVTGVWGYSLARLKEGLKKARGKLARNLSPSANQSAQKSIDRSHVLMSRWKKKKAEVLNKYQEEIGSYQHLIVLWEQRAQQLLEEHLEKQRRLAALMAEYPCP